MLFLIKPAAVFETLGTCSAKSMWNIYCMLLPLKCWFDDYMMMLNTLCCCWRMNTCMLLAKSTCCCFCVFYLTWCCLYWLPWHPAAVLKHVVCCHVLLFGLLFEWCWWTHAVIHTLLLFCKTTLSRIFPMFMCGMLTDYLLLHIAKCPCCYMLLSFDEPCWMMELVMPFRISWTCSEKTSVFVIVCCSLPNLILPSFSHE